MSDKSLLFFGPYDEFHQFNFFNQDIATIKNNYKKIIAVVPDTSSCIITNADEIICASNNYLSKVGANYPNILEKMECYERMDSGYNDSGFMKDAMNFVLEKEKDFDIYYYNTELFGREGCFRPYYDPRGKIFNNHSDIYAWIFFHFEMIGKSLENGYLIRPYIEDNEKIKEKYGKMFDHNINYIILTRNFKNKQSNLNNIKERDLKVINFLHKHNINVINVGFPSAFNFEIKNDKYKEISDNLSYSEFLCLSYLSDGIILSGECGSFSTHVCTAPPIFTLTEEWNCKDLMFNYRKKRNDLNIFKIINENNLEVLLEKRDYKREYSNRNKIIKVF